MQGRGGAITERAKRFAEIYVRTLDAARAYVEAGYEVRNKNGAGAAGARLKSKKEVKQYIDELFERERKRKELDRGKVIELLGAIAFTSRRIWAKFKRKTGSKKWFGRALKSSMKIRKRRLR